MGRQGRGAAAIEIAVVILVVVLLLTGIVSYGYMLVFKKAMSKASAAATQTTKSSGSLSSRARVDQVEAVVNKRLDGFGVRCSQGALRRGAEVVGTCAISEPRRCVFARQAADSCVSVALDYRYRDHSLLPTLPGLGFVLPQRLHFGQEVALS